ncbi:src-like-adapter isoform X2 [Oncorhynchus nerka]|uniref:src-like-adapter isoform X2 n=1 Tax=Oncorhynchus nerka TaxID=8023 RepID=UPI0031B8A6E3
MGNVWTSPVSMTGNGDDTNTSSDPFLRNNDTLRVLSDCTSADVSETLVVLSDYPSADVSVPLFRIGERLRLLAEEGYWWRVSSVQTGYENYIPNNHVAKVYHGWLFEGVARPKAEELLRLPGNRAGSFMIRESQKDCADGLCCILTTPCQAVTNGNLNLASQAPPVVMHNNFDWKDVNSSELTDQPHRYPGNRDSMISFGLRNTVSSYMSLGDMRKERKSTSWRRNKRRSVCVPPGHGLSTTALEEEEEGEYAQAILLNS